MTVSVDASPEEVLGKAEAYLVACGYTVETRTPNSVTAFTKPQFSWGLGCLSIILGGVPFLGYLLVLMLVKYRLTLAVTQSNGKTLVTTGGYEEGLVLLDEWVQLELQPQSM